MEGEDFSDKTKIYSNGGGSDDADNYNGTSKLIPVEKTVGNESFKDATHMDEKGAPYVDAINNKEEWITEPIRAIVHPYDSSTYVVVDGNHRRYAYLKTNTPEINAIIIPHSEVLLMKSEWQWVRIDYGDGHSERNIIRDKNEDFIPLLDVVNNKEIIDTYFVKPNGSHSFKKLKWNPDK